MNKIRTWYKKLSAPNKSSLWYTIANFLNKGIALISMPIFTRIMSQSEYGDFVIYQSRYNILIIVCTMNLFMSDYTKGLVEFKNDKARFTSSLLGLTTSITLIFAIIYFSFYDFFSNLLGIQPFLMGIMFAEMIAIPALEFWASREKFDYKYKIFVLISVMMSILSLIFGILFVCFFEDKVLGKVLGDVIPKIIICSILYVLIFIRGKSFFNWKYWKFAILYNLPLIPHYFSTFILNQADRIMIGNMIGTDKAAIYGVAYSVGTLMLLLVTALNNSYVPYIYKLIDGGSADKIKKNTKFLFGIVSIAVILTMLFAPEVIFIFAGEDYSEAIWIIPPVAASIYFIFMYSLYSNIEFYYKKNIFVSIASIIAAVLNIILNYVCIKYFGYIAAGYTTLICYMVLTIMHYISYKRIIKNKHNSKELYDLKTAVIFSIVTLAVMGICLALYLNIIARYLFIGVLIILCIIFYKTIIKLFKSMIGEKHDFKKNEE